MHVIVPVRITPDRLASSSVAEPGPDDGVQWSSSATYQPGDVVWLQTTHRRYRAAVENTNRNPATDMQQPPVWADIGATNRWAMFDDQVNTQTADEGAITIVLQPGPITSIALVEIDAAFYEVTVRDAPGGNVVFQQAGALEGSMPATWWDYFFMPFRPARELVINDIPAYHSAEVTITLTGSGRVAVGMVAVGESRYLGCAQWAARADFKDYSYIRTDEFGRTEIRRRPSAKNASIRVAVEREDADNVMRTLAEVLSVPCMWVGTDLTGFSGLRIFGLGSGEMSYDTPNLFFLSLSIKGLI